MSGLRDMWIKLKEKGMTIFSSGDSSPIHREEPSQGIQEKDKSSTVLVEAGGQIMQVHNHMPRLMCSEASISMLVDCFNP